VVDLMEALRKSVGGAAAANQAPKKPTKKTKKANPGLDETERPKPVRQVGTARRAVRDAKQAGDREAEGAARKAVDEVRRAL
jgi:DNA end-binding protein Ku